jgi:hypothetical protein
MNESQIQTLLRHPAKITAPPNLLAQLQANISLTPSVAADVSPLTLPFFKRWFPALSFGLVVFGCLIALAIQTTELGNVRREIHGLQQSASAVDEPVPNDTAQILEMLHKDHAELQSLRAEIEQLRQLLAQLPELQSQIEALRAQVQAQSAAVLTNSDDPFAAAEAKAKSIQCISNMKQIGLALRMWYSDHQDKFPPDVLSASDEMNTPKILVCPADKRNLPAESLWDRFDPSRVSYEYFGAGQTDVGDPEPPLTRCRIHGHVGLFDGSVHMNSENRFRVVPENGKYKFIRQ